jgi:hypothetical protein
MSRPQMNAAEAAAVAAFAARRERVAPIASPQIETRSGLPQFSFDHASQAVAHALIANALGTGNAGLALGILAQLTDVSRTGTEAKAAELDFMLRLVQGIGPQDEIEPLLAVQMAAIHNATMTRRCGQPGQVWRMCAATQISVGVHGIDHTSWRPLCFWCAR